MEGKKMAGSKGYYSLIQYCPDRSRLEVANVGVMLFCPELRFLKISVAKGNDRVRRIFKVSGEDLERINEAKRAIAERLRIEGAKLPSLEHIQQFVLTRGNDIILTQPRPMKVIQPDADLKVLFADLVGGRRHRTLGAKQSEIPELDKALQSDRIKNRVFRSVQIQLPLTERHITFPYAFRNGKLNLIQPERFSAKESEIFQRASFLALNGSLLSHHPDPIQGTDRKLIVVSAFSDSSHEAMQRVDKLFHEYQVRHIPMGQIDILVKEIEQQAHEQ
jgi:hypothetical protein